MNTARADGVRVLGWLSLAAVLFVGSGCQTAAYRPQHSWSRVGYSSYPAGNDRWDVTYSGPMKSEPERIKDFTLLRCAEITAQAGRRYFVVLGSNSRPQTSRLVSEPATTNVSGLQVDGALDREMVFPNPILTVRIVTADAVPSDFLPKSTYEAKPLIAQMRAKYGLKDPKR